MLTIVAVVGLFEVAVAGAAFAVLSTWLNGGSRAPYGMSEAIFLGLGFLPPLAATVIGVFMPGLLWIEPLAIGVACAYTRGARQRRESAHRRLIEEKLAQADEAARRDPANAYAFCLKAEAYEAMGKPVDALVEFARARDLKSKAYTDAAFADDEKRLKRAAAEAASRPAPTVWSSTAYIAAIAVLAAPTLLMSVAHYATVVSAWLFAFKCLDARQD